MAKIRTTLTIDESALDRYKRMAELQRESLSSTVSAWLETSADSAEMLARRIAAAKASANPARAIKELTATLQAGEEGYSTVKQIAKRGPADRAERATSGRPGPIPPSCNTGGKVPERTKGGRT